MQGLPIQHVQTDMQSSPFLSPQTVRDANNTMEDVFAELSGVATEARNQNVEIKSRLEAGVFLSSFELVEGMRPRGGNRRNEEKDNKRR